MHCCGHVSTMTTPTNITSGCNMNTIADIGVSRSGCNTEERGDRKSASKWRLCYMEVAAIQRPGIAGVHCITVIRVICKVILRSETENVLTF